jgi:hypothetical protein
LVLPEIVRCGSEAVTAGAVGRGTRQSIANSTPVS